MHVRIEAFAFRPKAPGARQVHNSLLQCSEKTINSMNACAWAQVAGGKDESVTQPMWTPKNELLFVSDRTGWWNIYQENDGQVALCCSHNDAAAAQ